MLEKFVEIFVDENADYWMSIPTFNNLIESGARIRMTKEAHFELSDNGITFELRIDGKIFNPCYFGGDAKIISSALIVSVRKGNNILYKKIENNNKKDCIIL